MQQKLNRFFGILLSLVLMLGPVPGMSLTAYADDPYASLKNTTKVIKFDSMEWYLIGYDASTVTLLSKECIGASTFGENSTYSGSTVETFVNKYYTNSISTGAKKAVNGGMFLLTYDQAKTISDKSFDVLECSQAIGATDKKWWLSSPGNDGEYGILDDSKADYVNVENGTVSFMGDPVTNTYGVRPALQLNLASVIFSSVNLSGGANATASGGSITQNYFDVGTTRSPMTAVTYTANSGYKFPETSNYYTTTNGIIVERTSDTVVTVSGTPTANTTITIPDAHTHSFTYAASGGIITATCGGSGTCDITEGLTLTISAPTGNLVYDGTTTYPAALSTGYNTTAFPGTYSISYTKDGSAYSGVPKDAGTYTASITAGTGDAAKTASVSYTIAKAASTITTAPTAGEITYGQTLANSTLTGGEESVAGGFAWKDSTIAPAVSDSQKTEYDVVFTPTDGNYGTAECKVKLMVNKADSAVIKAPAAKTLTYTGSAQALVDAGTATGGEMQYALGTATEATEPYTTSIPTKTNAGTYYVWYKVVGDANHNDSDPKCVSVTISAAGSPDNQNPEKKDPDNGGSNQGGGNQTVAKTEKITISKRPTAVKAKAKKNKVTVSWKKIKKNKAGKKLLKQIKSIQVQYSTDKTFKKDVNTKTVGKKKTKVKLKLQKKTTYFFRVRYKGANGFSKWSKVKKVKTK